MKAIEEAGRTLRGWVDGVYLSCPDDSTMTAEDDAAYKAETDALAQRVVTAYLTALAEDDAAVEAVARAICESEEVPPDEVAYTCIDDGSKTLQWETSTVAARAAIRAMGGE